ncbi:MAG TPA: hypothetical protein VKP65_14960 [Rhodothermales bacterium]|nr:hypothetical protein [Rhodothermales bacterium]
MRQGCLLPLLISTGLLLFLGIVMVIAYFDTFRLMGQNMAAMGEGRELAESIRSPDDLLAYIADHPEAVSLITYEVGQEDAGVFYGADSLRPVVGVTRLLVLLDYARQTEQGLIDADSRVPLDTLASYFLPVSDQGGHDRLVQYFVAQDAIDADSTVAWEAVADAMMQGFAAATDLLIDQLGRDQPGQLSEKLDLSLEAPLPSNGLFLSWSNHTLTSPPEQRLARLQSLSPAVYADSVYNLAAAYRHDFGFQWKERARLIERGTDLNLRQQRALAQATLPRGTARAYVHLLTQALSDSLLTPAISQRLIEGIERPLGDSTQAVFQRIGSQAGSFPGLISFVGFAQRAGSSRTRVVALFMDDLPIAVFYHLMQTGIDRGFVVQLLGDDAYVEQVRQRLSASAGGVRLGDGASVVAR